MKNDYLEQQLGAFIEKRSCVYAAAFSRDAREIFRRGDTKELKWHGLPDSLIGTPEAITRLNASVTTGTFQIFGQGNARALVFRPHENLLVTLFDEFALDDGASYRDAKSCMAQLVELNLTQ